MKTYKILRLNDDPALLDRMALWFSEKWGIDKLVYLESMRASLAADAPVPRWYAATDEGRIIAGAGVIENDFHERHDLTPNVCAVYTQPEYREQGIAGAVLDYICGDMHSAGIDTLYLLTDHIGFYERYGWRFYTMVRSDGGEISRMYVHTISEE